MEGPTPGPWKAEPTMKHLSWAVYAKDQSEYAAEDDLYVVASDLTEQNATMIAAAPAMLAALKAIRDGGLDEARRNEVIRITLALAEGRL